MRVFVTGASGFIGTAVIKELIDAGHEVLGLARSEASAKIVTDLGAAAHRGDIEDIESLRSGAAWSDGVIHTAFNHDFSKIIANCEADRLAVEALGEVLAGSSRPLLVTAGTGSSLSEDDPPTPINPSWPRASEVAAMALADRGVHAVSIRLPQVHDPYKQGLVTYLIAVARDKGVSAYVGEGLNRWPAVHRLDAAKLYKLAFENGTPGARYNVVGEEGVPLRQIAEVIGKGLDIHVVSLSPEEAMAHFGWLGGFASYDIPSSSKLTQERLNWHPTGPTLISDLEQLNWV
jgi:nucleoside-diphosphate-sugar epimerase